MIDISIIIPTYHPKSWLEDALLSVSKQTFDKLRFEIIIIINGERKEDYIYVMRIVNKILCNNIFSIITTKIKGVSNARNLGIINATGDYLTFLDDDDIIDFDYLKRLYKNSNKRNITVSNVKTFTNNIRVNGDDYITKSFSNNRNTKSNNIFKLRSFLSSSCCKLIPKEIIGNTLFDIRVNNGEDALFMYSLSGRIKNIVLTDTIYYRRIREKSASRKKRGYKERINNILYLIKEYCKIFFYQRKKNIALFVSRIVATIISNIK